MIESGIPVGKRPESHLGIMGTNQQPWLPIESINFLSENLKKNFIGFEFGSGSSSFWFSNLTIKLYSVESDPIWFKMMLDIASLNKIQNIEFSCVEAEMLPIWDVDIENSGNYKIYSDKIFQVDSQFDYILIDGVGRSLCIENSINKLKSGGFLIIDNSERPAYWNAIEKIPVDWKRYEFINSIDTTLIYQKPLEVL